MPNQKPLCQFSTATPALPYVFPCWINAPSKHDPIHEYNGVQGVGFYTGSGNVVFAMEGGKSHMEVERKWLAVGVLPNAHTKPAYARKAEATMLELKERENYDTLAKVIGDAAVGYDPKTGKPTKPLAKLVAFAINRFDAACHEHAHRGSAHVEDQPAIEEEYLEAREKLEQAINFYDVGAEAVREFGDMVLETAAKFNSMVRKVRDSRGV